MSPSPQEGGTYADGRTPDLVFASDVPAVIAFYG